MMVREEAPVPLPGEVFTLCQPQVSLKLECLSAPQSSPTIDSSSGTIFASAQRIVYLPKKPVTYHIPERGDRNFESLTTPVDGIKEPRVVSPWFGPNRWECMFKGAGSQGGLEGHWRLRFTFNDGGVVKFNEFFSNLNILPPYPG